jgi:hypothetical protein
LVGEVAAGDIPPRDLGFLWLAFVVHSIVAFFAILITGASYEPSFDFNLGMLRWSCGGSLGAAPLLLPMRVLAGNGRADVTVLIVG